MENFLQDINRNFISLSPDEVRRNNRILGSVLRTFIDKMKEKDPMFAAMYSGIFYGGSYYDGLRIYEPAEFDIDILLRLPRYASPTLTTSNIPGFMHLQLANFDGWMRQPEAKPAYNNFARLLDDKRYLCTDKVLFWIQGVVQRALNDFPMSGSKTILSNEEGIFQITVHQGGPARTLKISGAGMLMDVDLVACFVFGPDKWPTNGFRANPVPSKPNFFIVPKRPKPRTNAPIPRYWRLSFQEQERVLIDNKRTLKPTVKLLKRLRDNEKHTCIASYYIKTVILHIAERKDDQFWRQPLSHVFMTVLREYKDFIERKKIPYYWNKNNNLLQDIHPGTLDNVHYRLRVVIRDLENRPETVVDYLGDRSDRSTTQKL